MIFSKQQSSHLFYIILYVLAIPSGYPLLFCFSGFLVHYKYQRFLGGIANASNRFRGFSSIAVYLVWNNFVNYAKESEMEKRNIFLTFVLKFLKF